MSKDLKELSKITTRYKNRINEWNDTTFKTLPKRWSKPIDSFRDTNKDGLTELERKEAYGFNSGGQTKVANPINQKYDFKKPTIISMSKQDLKTLHQTGTIEINGITIVYEK